MISLILLILCLAALAAGGVALYFFLTQREKDA